MSNEAPYSKTQLNSLLGRRIQVVGHAGAGKSVFSEKLAAAIQAPVVHLDPIFWSKDWVSTPVEEAQSIVREHVKKPDWVVDGNQWVPLKQITYPLATDIIWVDPPFHVWIYRLFSRAIQKAWSESGSFYKDFLNPKTSIIVLAFQRREKKARNWAKMLECDSRWQRVTDTSAFLRSIDGCDKGE
ncbi:hypothetical protein GALMADRAFT_228160 [Galerina marginata CBS 339.88]|uniref:Adenylate kinase n=1 Tax=Galerina marginata (strain CBS 339.88) TaxID=685588 RepID=A0A067SUG0_GALM3|nr:hypothetical protein GALMADRAFT_228160 [Galerina marginata CBS 339.88]